MNFFFTFDHISVIMMQITQESRVNSLILTFKMGRKLRLHSHSDSTINLSGRAFSLVELLVAIAIVGLLVALIAPSILQVRSTANAIECRNNLRQISIAIGGYESSFSVLPSLDSTEVGPFAAIHPYYRGQIVLELPSNPNAIVRYMRLQGRSQILICPQSSVPTDVTSYSGNIGFAYQIHGFNSVFRPLQPSQSRKFYRTQDAGPLQVRDVTDGASYTTMISEYIAGSPRGDHRRGLARVFPGMLAEPEFNAFQSTCRTMRSFAAPMTDRDFVWWDATSYNHVLTPNSPSCTNGGWHYAGALTATSEHMGGVHLSLVDGSVRFVAETIDAEIWAAIGTRSGSEVVGDF